MATILSILTVVSVTWLAAGIGIYVTKWLMKAGRAEEKNILEFVDTVKSAFKKK